MAKVPSIPTGVGHRQQHSSVT